jgi:subtilisin family serine protease
MRILKNLTLLLVFYALSATLGFAETNSIDSKIDPMLIMLSQKEIGIDMAKTMNMLKGAPDGGQMVKTIVRFRGNLDGVESLGGTIGSVRGDIAIVDIPLNSLNALSQMDNIIYIEASKKVKPSLDISVPATGADLLRGGIPPLWTGITGKGVIIGIVDTGIDLTHPDFKDADGNTRILYLKDQTTGQECTNVMIDNQKCNETDTEGHGTHVSGIAAGNGSASNFRYVGMAPEADLIFVKTTFDTQAILDGISYIEQKAASFGKPCVINLSLGGRIDPHDGTSNYSRGLDNDSGPGEIIVGAAGNEADDGIHASGNVSQGKQTQRAFNVRSGTSEVIVDTWYSGSDSMSVEVIPPGCNSTGPVAPGESNIFTNACGNIVVASNLNDPNNGDKEIYIDLRNPSPGRWAFSLSGSSIANGRFDSWTATDNEDATFESPDSSVTLDDTGCTTRVISAASYVTRPVFLSDPSAGHISSFSSRGPRRLCSKCSYVQKPDIAAPGQWIMSAFSKDTRFPETSLLDPFGGPYILDQGTSMSSPHVAGAVALLLQQNPALTPEEVKDSLFQAAEADSFTGSVPNDIWGYGKLNADNVLDNVSTPTVTGPSSLVPNVDYTFSAGGASSSAGHDIQYFFDWGDGTNSGWLPVGTTNSSHSWAMPGIYLVEAQARDATDTSIVSNWSPGLAVNVVSITLQQPLDNSLSDPCSLYSLPVFSWTAEETFKSYKIQFSSDNSFSSIPVRVRSSATEAAMSARKWEKVLLIPGKTGGTVYWRIIATRADKTTSKSNVYSITVQSPQTAGSPVLSSASKSSLPSLSWQNNCNVEFKVRFSNDFDYTKHGIKKKALTFHIKNPGDNGGTFTRQLTKGQWNSIRKLVGDVSGSTIYWYVKSRDALKRSSSTPVMNFNLTD